jgi:hypothetical protein
MHLGNLVKEWDDAAQRRCVICDDAAVDREKITVNCKQDARGASGFSGQPGVRQFARQAVCNRASGN